MRASVKATVAALALASAGAGCAQPLSPPKQAQLDLLECRAKALAPVVEPAFDALELARDVYLGRASLPTVLRELGAGEQEIRELVKALRACELAPEPAPERTAG